MQYIFIFVIFVTFLNSSDWIERLKKNNIIVETRQTELSDIDEFKATALINSPLFNILNVIENPKLCSTWIKYCKSDEVIKIISSNIKIKRTITEMPWPLQNRESVVKYIKTYAKDKNLVSIAFFSESENYPVDKNSEFVRIDLLKGFWILEEIEHNLTKVIYQVLAEPKNIPAWLVNSGVVEQPYETLLNLKNMMEAKK